MKRFFPLVLGVLFFANAVLSAAEDSNVTKQLRSKYAMAQYHPEYGGWYLIRYTSDGQTYYGFCDNKGNVVAQNATEYKLYKGYIELYILDINQKQQHDYWEQQMFQYKKDYAKYDKIRGDYQNELNAYNARVKDAEKEARQRYNSARDAAYNDYIRRASAQMQQAAQSNTVSSGGGYAALGAALGNLIGTTIAASTMKKNAQAAADAVKYDPIYKQVLAQRGLSYPPTEPYNPKPTQPKEPGTGFSWETYPLLQPCPYSYIEYSAIQEAGNYANVKKDGEYGLVDASLKEIYPCTNPTSVKKGMIFEMQKVLVNGQYGLLNRKSEEVFKPIYDELVEDGELVMAKKKGLWALYNKKGVALTEHLYNSYQAKGENFLCEQNGKKALVSRSGKSLLPPNLDKVVDIEDNLYCFRDNQVGLYTQTGKMIFPIEFSSMELIGDYFKVKKDDHCGLYTKTAQVVYPCEYQDLKLGTIDKRQVIYLEDDNDMWGLRDVVTNDTILPIIFTDITVRKYNDVPFLLTNITGKFGLYNETGLLLIPCDFDEITDIRLFNRTVFKATNGEFVSLFDRMGMKMIPSDKYTSFEWKEPFYYVKNGTKKGIVSMRGQEIVPCEYDNISYVPTDSCFIATVNNKNTIVTMQGKTLFEPIDYRIIRTNKSYIVVMDNNTGRMGLCSYKGRLFIPTKHKDYRSLTHAYETFVKKFNTLIDVENNDNLKLIKADNIIMQENEQIAAKKRMSFAYFAQAHVEKAINSWQKRLEYEKTVDWEQRVNEQTRSQRVRALTKEAEKLYIEREKRFIKLDLQLQRYDPDNEVFLVTDTTFGNMLVPVPINEAENFRKKWQSIKTTPTFFINDDQMAISKMVFEIPSGKKYEYSNDKALNYEVADVTYNFDPLDRKGNTLASDVLTSVEIVTPFTMQEISSVLASYNNDFQSFNMPDLDVPFPFALFRVKLEGDTKSIRTAKQILRLYLGQMYATESMITNYPNQILFLIPVGVRHVYLDAGDGIKRETLFDGPLHYNKIYDGVIRVK